MASAQVPSFLRRARRALRRLTLTRQIFIGLIVGIIAGALCGHFAPDQVGIFKPFSDLFLRFIKMIIAPIIFTSLVAGVAGAGHVRKVGRMGIWAFVFFEITAFLALLGGLIAVNVAQPGRGVTLVGVHDMAKELGSNLETKTWDQLLLHAVPNSVIEAMATGDVLQIVVFTILFALALGTLGERAKPVVELCEICAAAMFKLTKVLMHYAPIGVAAAIAYTVGTSGLVVLLNLLKLVLTLYVTLGLFVGLVLLPIAMWYGVPLRKFWRVVREPTVIAFSTTSSEAALPRAMEGLQLLGVPRRIVSFILPFGYSFNLAGTTLYLTLGAVFCAQVSHVTLTWGQQLTMLATFMLTSKGVAAVPRASLVILAGTLSTYGVPLEGLSLIMGVDTLMDMARTSVNVFGNCLATVIVAKREGEFVEASDEVLNRFDAPPPDEAAAA